MVIFGVAYRRPFDLIARVSRSGNRSPSFHHTRVRVPVSFSVFPVPTLPWPGSRWLLQETGISRRPGAPECRVTVGASRDESPSARRNPRWSSPTVPGGDLETMVGGESTEGPDVVLGDVAIGQLARHRAHEKRKIPDPEMEAVMASKARYLRRAPVSSRRHSRQRKLRLRSPCAGMPQDRAACAASTRFRYVRMRAQVRMEPGKKSCNIGLVSDDLSVTETKPLDRLRARKSRGPPRTSNDPDKNARQHASVSENGLEDTLERDWELPSALWMTRAGCFEQLYRLRRDLSQANLHARANCTKPTRSYVLLILIDRIRLRSGGQHNRRSGQAGSVAAIPMSSFAWWSPPSARCGTT